MRYSLLNLNFSGILTNIKKESEDQKVDSSEAGSSSSCSETMSFPSGHDADGLHYRVQGTFSTRFLDDAQLSPGSNSSMMNPNGSSSSTSWLFPNSGGGFTDHGLHSGHHPPTSNATYTPASAFEENRVGAPGANGGGGNGNPTGSNAAMIPFSQTDLNFVDSLTAIHPVVSQQQQQKTTPQNQHFVTSSTLHPSSLSVVEATDSGIFSTFHLPYGLQCLPLGA